MDPLLYFLYNAEDLRAIVRHHSNCYHFSSKFIDGLTTLIDRVENDVVGTLECCLGGYALGHQGTEGRSPLLKGGLKISQRGKYSFLLFRCAITFCKNSACRCDKSDERSDIANAADWAERHVVGCGEVQRKGGMD